MTPEQEKFADRLAELMAKSTLYEEVKDLILDHIDEIPEEKLKELAADLEEENKILDKLSEDIQAYTKDHAALLKKIEFSQHEKAKTMIDEFIKKETSGSSGN